MKACITTFQSAYNYGAVLQAFALQEYLNENFVETCVLDYHNKEIDASYQNPDLKDFIHNPKNALFKTVQGVLYKGKKKKLDDFRNRYLRLTNRYDGGNISEAKNEADIFITGSDQVWNYLLIGNDNNYFLDFAKEKITCSYAASFGVSEIPVEYIEFYRKNLQNIKFISVREKQGTSIVQDIIGCESETLCDPTLLLTQGDWKKLEIKPQIKNKYILVYKITKTDKLLTFAKKLSRITGLPIIYIPNDLKAGVIGKTIFNVGPEEWLGFIDNAEYVVTNSFHGTVFSIILGKRFFCEVSKRVNPSTSRLLSLLESFDLKNRIISEECFDLLYDDIDEAHIRSILESQLNRTCTYFSKVMKKIDCR